MLAGTIKLTANSWMALDQLGSATWTGGDLSSEGGADTKIYIYNDTVFTIRADASKLGASLIIGESRTAAPSRGTVHIAKEDGSADLAANLGLYKNANIVVKGQGILNLNQKVQSSTKGGIVAMGMGSTSEILNEGTIDRRIQDPDPEQYLTIDAKVTNKTGGAKFYMQRDTTINFVRGFDGQKGLVEFHPSAKVKGHVMKKDGVMRFFYDGPPGRYDVFFSDGDLTITGGIVEFVSTVPGGYGTVHITGNFFLGVGVEVFINVDGSVADSSDEFEVGGTTTIDSAILNVNTEFASPLPGDGYTFLNSTEILGSWAGLPVNTGYPADYFFEDLGRIGVPSEFGPGGRRRR